MNFRRSARYLFVVVLAVVIGMILGTASRSGFKEGALPSSRVGAQDSWLLRDSRGQDPIEQLARKVMSLEQDCVIIEAERLKFQCDLSSDEAAPPEVKVIKDIVQLTNILLSKMEESNLTSVLDVDLSAELSALPDLISFWGGIGELQASESPKVSSQAIEFPEEVCGWYPWPKPDVNGLWTFRYASSPASWLASNGYHLTSDYASGYSDNDYTRPQTYRSDICGEDNYRDHAYIWDEVTINEQNYTVSPYGIEGEPNPEVFHNFGLGWPYPSWPLYVAWWHFLGPGGCATCVGAIPATFNASLTTPAGKMAVSGRVSIVEPVGVEVTPNSNPGGNPSELNATVNLHEDPDYCDQRRPIVNGIDAHTSAGTTNPPKANAETGGVDPNGVFGCINR